MSNAHSYSLNQLLLMDVPNPAFIPEDDDIQKVCDYWEDPRKGPEWRITTNRPYYWAECMKAAKRTGRLAELV